MSYFCEGAKRYTYYGVATSNIGNNPHSIKIDDGYGKLIWGYVQTNLPSSEGIQTFLSTASKITKVHPIVWVCQNILPRHNNTCIPPNRQYNLTDILFTKLDIIVQDLCQPVEGEGMLIIYKLFYPVIYGFLFNH